MICKHKWHLRRVYNNDVDIAIGSLETGYSLETKKNKDPKEFAEFICEICGENKEVELK